MAYAIHRDTHHVDVHDITDWKAGALAGLIAGIVFAALEMLLMALVLGANPWTPVYMIAGIVMGAEALAATGFALGTAVVGVLVHVVLSVLLGLAIGWLVHRFDMGMALMAGAVIGVAIYLVNFHVFVALFPWFAELRNWITVLNQIIFGMVAAGSYVALRKPPAEHRH